MRQYTHELGLISNLAFPSPHLLPGLVSDFLQLQSSLPCNSNSNFAFAFFHPLTLFASLISCDQ